MKRYYVRPPASKVGTLSVPSAFQADFDASPLTTNDDNGSSKDCLFDGDSMTVLRYMATMIGAFDPLHVRL
jgi:hypothetical protein